MQRRAATSEKGDQEKRILAVDVALALVEYAKAVRIAEEGRGNACCWWAMDFAGVLPDQAGEAIEGRP